MNRINQIVRRVLKEATGDSSGGRGSYIAPMQPGLRPFSGESLQPYTDAVSKWKSPLVQYDSYDDGWDLRWRQIKELERTAAKIQDYIKHHPFSTFSDDDGSIVNQYFQDSKKAPYKEKMEPYTIKVNEWVEVANNGVLNEDLAVWFGKKVEEVINDIVKEYDYPVCYHFPVSHEKENYALKIGGNYELKITKATVLLSEL